ncbi:MAG: TolC family protein [Myxococcales bacterium]|nr:TolC family protein [Myxococcota bacterium]MDW8283202.1 TolC family protein [Myxococcales bacterium]
MKRVPFSCRSGAWGGGLLLLTAAMLAGWGAARAQGQDPPPLTLTMEEALRRGEENVPLLVRARNEQLLVEARRAGAAVLQQFNPLVTFMGGYRYEETSTPPASGFQYQLHVEQMLEMAGQRGTRLRAVEAAVAVARASTEYARTLMRAIVGGFYVRAVVGEQRLAVSRSREETARRLLESARARRDLGASSEIEVNLARIEEGRVAAEVTAAKVALEAQLNELRVLCAIPAGTPLHLPSYQGEPPPLPPAYRSVSALLDLALKQRADLLAIRRQRAALEADRQRLIREALPNPILAFDHQRDLPGQDFYGGTVGLQIPLWNRNQGPLALVQAAETARRNEERLLRLRLEAEVSLALNRLMLLSEQAQSFRLRALPPAEQNLELLQRGWQAGKFDLFRVIVASRELAETRLRYLDILDDLWEAAIELERSVGQPLFSGGSK